MTVPENLQNYFEIKCSNIKGAGLGIFAKCDISKDFKMGYYTGTMLNEDELENTDSDKIMTISDKPPWWKTDLYGEWDKDIYIDGSGCWLSKINDHRGSKYKQNTTFDTRGQFSIIRDIKKGCELFIDYGDEYWFDRLMNLFDEDVEYDYVVNIIKESKCYYKAIMYYIGLNRYDMSLCMIRYPKKCKV